MTEEAVKVYEEHELGWQDGGTALVVGCGDVTLSGGGFTLTSSAYSYGTEKARTCPNCGKALRLVWKVHVEVVDAPQEGPDE